MLIPLFLIPILAGLIAQGLKPLLNKHWYAELTERGRKIPRYGGMPSAHTAFATSLATVVGLADGFASATFAIAAAIVIFVLDDALRMRIFLSRHGQALSQLVDRLPAAERAQYPYLEARLGHAPREVVAGAVLGVALSLSIVFLFKAGVLTK